MASTAPVTIEELLEIEAIKRVRILYSHYFDMADIDSLMELFTDDAVCEFGPNYGGDWVGKERIRAGYEEFSGDAGQFTGAMHANTNEWIELTGANTAKARWYLLDLSLSGPADQNPLMLMGIYDDMYRKVDGQWKIERTYIDFVWPNRQYRGPREG